MGEIIEVCKREHNLNTDYIMKIPRFAEIKYLLDHAEPVGAYMTTASLSPPFERSKGDDTFSIK